MGGRHLGDARRVGKFYRWDGTAWSIVPGQEIPGAVGVERHGGLAAVGPCDVWAVGSYNFGTTPVLPLIEHLVDDGIVGDLDGDGDAGFGDLVTLLAAWGPNPGHPADMDGDGDVGFADLLMLLSAWS